MPDRPRSFFASLVHCTSDAYDALCGKSKQTPSGLKPLRLSREVSLRERRIIPARLKLPRDIIRKASAPYLVFNELSPSEPRSPLSSYSLDMPSSEVSTYSRARSSTLSLPYAPLSPVLFMPMGPKDAAMPEEVMFDKDADADASWDFKCCAGKRESRNEAAIDELNEVEKMEREIQENILAEIDGLLSLHNTSSSNMAQPPAQADTSELDPHGPSSSRAVELVASGTVDTKEAADNMGAPEARGTQVAPVERKAKWRKHRSQPPLRSILKTSSMLTSTAAEAIASTRTLDSAIWAPLDLKTDCSFSMFEAGGKCFDVKKVMAIHSFGTTPFPECAISGSLASGSESSAVPRRPLGTLNCNITLRNPDRLFSHLDESPRYQQEIRRTFK